MKPIHCKNRFLRIGLLVLFAACAQTPPVPDDIDPEPAVSSVPDLVPVRMKGPDGRDMPGPEGFCRVEGPKLKILLKNLGPPTSQISTTSVVLFSQGKYTRYHLETPPVGDNGIELDVSLPEDACFVRCVFTITVDSKNSIPEGSGEENNKVDGLCLG